MKELQLQTLTNYYCFFHAVERVIQHIHDQGKTAEDARELTAISTTADITARCSRCICDTIDEIDKVTDRHVHSYPIHYGGKPMAKQETLPECDPLHKAPMPVRVLLNHSSIKLHTAASLDRLAIKLACAVHPDQATHRVAWNLATFRGEAPVLIVTFRLQEDGPHHPDRAITHLL